MLSHKGLDLSLPIFSGPLEDLLGLVDEGLISPADIPVKEVVVQCLAYSLGSAVEEATLVALCSRLVRAKAAALLAPKSPAKEGSAVAEAEPKAREELRQLVLMAVEAFEGLVIHGGRSFRRRQPGMVPDAGPRVLPVPLEGLAELAKRRLAELADRPGPLAVSGPTLQECVERVRSAVQHATRLAFSELMSQCRDRLEVILTFLAVLELVREGFLEAHQEESFGEIWIEAR